MKAETCAALPADHSSLTRCDGTSYTTRIFVGRLVQTRLHGLNQSVSVSYLQSRFAES